MEQGYEKEGLTTLSGHGHFLESINGVEKRLNLISTSELKEAPEFTLAKIKRLGLGLGDLIYEMQRLANKHSSLFDIKIMDPKAPVDQGYIEDVRRYHLLRELINGQYPIGSS